MSKHASRKRQRRATGESRSAEMLTVGWSLMVVTTLVCTLLAAVAGSAFRWYYPQASAMGMFAALMWFAAAVVGLAAVVVTPVVIRSRRVPPPRSIVVAALVIGVLPTVAIVLSQTFRFP